MLIMIVDIYNSLLYVKHSIIRVIEEINIIGRTYLILILFAISFLLKYLPIKKNGSPTNKKFLI